MRFANPWEVLGLPPTGEAREIRRAYARLLKSIDVEDEPERFATLREAFERALALAEAGVIVQPSEEVEESTAADDRWTTSDQSDVPETQPEGSVSRSETLEPDSAQHAEITEINRHAEALERLLTPHYNEWTNASQDEAEAMLAHWAAIAADPRLEDLGFYAQAENWIAEMVARACPFSDPLAPLVAERFGWFAGADLLGQSPAVRFILDRCATLAFLQDIAQKSHPLHRAWRELTKPATEKSRRGWGTSRRRVAELLTVIRRDHPAVERYLDSWRVGLWENPQPKIGLSGVGIGLFLAFQLLRFLLLYPNEAPHHSAPVIAETVVEQTADRLTQPEPDIDRVVKILSRNYVTAARTKNENPALFADLSEQWEKTKSQGGNIWDLQTSVDKMVIGRFGRVYDKAPYEQIRALRQVELDEALFYRDISPQLCNAFFAGEKTNFRALPIALEDRRRDAVYDILLHTGGDRQGYVRTGSFMVPASVMREAADRASLSDGDFRAAMQYKGTAVQGCEARIAFSRTVLNLPAKQGLKLLRSM